jgi:hypothetical protein
MPRNLDVRLVMDRDATHMALLVRNWLTCGPRRHVHLTPANSSRLSQVERLFAVPTAKQVKDSISALHAAINAFSTRTTLSRSCSDGPSPLDDVLASIERFCAHNTLAYA